MKLSYNSYYEDLSRQSLSDADRLYWMLEAVRGVKYHPLIFPVAPKFYEISKRRAEKTFRQVLCDAQLSGYYDITDKHRAAYWSEINRGQFVSEDAGGYTVRCLTALLTGQVSNDDGVTYTDIMRKILDEDCCDCEVFEE